MKQNTDTYPLTRSVSAGIVVFAAVFVYTQVNLWPALLGAKAATVVGFGTWAMIEIMLIFRVAYEIWQEDRARREKL